jgi:quercetin dioxygenase-like cupin family protein
MSTPIHVRQTEPLRWEGVPLLAYKEEGTTFLSVTRQVLYQGKDGLGTDLRYFEVAAGGHSSLERHAHEHLVLVARGRGRCLVGGRLLELSLHDVVHVPPMAWHQFRATGDEPLGFLCMVRSERDRPQLPSQEDLRALRSDPAVAAFIRV